ncbi:unnamed protein product, partial [Prunus brigantina]
PLPIFEIVGGTDHSHTSGLTFVSCKTLAVMQFPFVSSRIGTASRIFRMLDDFVDGRT